MADPIWKIWVDLETWLKGHSPSTLADLAGGASDAELLALERLDVPADLLQSLKLHDGEPSFASFRLMTARRILERTSSLRKVVPGWKDAWVPFAEDSGGNCFLVGDGILSYDRSSRRVSVVDWPRRYSSYTDWLSGCRDEALSGKFAVDEEGFVYRI